MSDCYPEFETPPIQFLSFKNIAKKTGKWRKKKFPEGGVLCAENVHNFFHYRKKYFLLNRKKRQNPSSVQGQNPIDIPGSQTDKICCHTIIWN